MAKRVNTRFLIVLTAVFACLIAAAVVAKVTVFRKDPRAFEAAGDKEFKEGNYKKAVEYYRAAAAASDNPNGALVKSGDALNMLVADDPQNLYGARTAWSQAVAKDPKYEPALQRLLDSYWEHMEVNPFDVDYARMRETAERLADVRPGDVKARAKSYIATLRPWLDGTPAKRGDVDAAYQSLQKLIARDRSDAEMRYYVARYKLRASAEKRDRGDLGEADSLGAEAGATFDDAMQDPPKDPEANALMHLRAFDIYGRLDRIDKAAAAEAERRKSKDVIVVDPATGPGAGGKDAAAKGPRDYGAKAQKALAAAIEAAKSLPVDGALYFDIHVQAAEQAMRQKRVADAEKVCEDLLAKRPDDQKTRLVYARLLASTPAKREKAIEILSREVKVGRMVGPRGFEASQRRVETLVDLIGTKIDQARALAAAVPQSQEAATSTAKQRQELVAEIRSDMQRLEPMIPGESVSVLRLKARLQQLEGKPADAIQTYQRAVTLMEGSPQERKDYDLINELAVAYLQAGQTGSAKKLLEQIIRQYDWYVPARLQMAQLLMNENKLPDAKSQMREAEKQLVKMPGDSQDYGRIRAEFDRTGLMLMKLEGNPRLNESYANLPETTRAEKLNKAAVARQIGKNDEAVRLAGAAVKEDPKDLAALESLLGALLSTDRRQDALAALDAAIAANPDKAQRLQPARERLSAAVELSNATPQQVYERRKELLLKEPESVARSVKLSDLERDYGHVDAAEKVLLGLHEKNPSETSVLTRLFDLNVNRTDWAKARGYLDKLVALNADEAGGLLFQYRLAMSQKNHGEGLRLAKALVAARPEFDVSWVAYGQALQAHRRYAEAIKQYQFARQRKPLNLEAMRGTIECYAAQNQQDSAREALSEARALFPNDPVFRDLELQHQLNYGDPMVAVVQLEQAWKDHPELAKSSLELAQAYVNAARTRPDEEKASLRAKAKGLLEKGMARWDNDIQFVKGLAELLLESGDAAAGEKLLKAYAARPDRKERPEGDLLLAEFYARTNKPDDAEAGYYSGLKKLTDQAAADAAAGRKDAAAAAGSAANEVRIQLSQALAQRRKFDEALKVLEGAEGGAQAGITTGDRRVFNQRLNVLIMSQQRHLAEQALLDAIAKGGAEDMALQMMLVRVNFDGGRYDEALERVNKVLKADPDSLEAHFFRGQVLLRRPQPDVDGAVAELLLVRKGDPGNAATRILLADAYRKQGDTPKAIRELQEGLTNDATSRELRLRLMDFRSTEGSKDLNDVLRLIREARNNPQLKEDPIWAVREARVWAERRDWPKAIAAIEDAARLAPTDAGIVREYQSVLLMAEDYKRVVDQTERLVRENRAPWWVFMNRAAARNGMKDPAGAMSEFNLALTAAGGDNAAVEQIVKKMTTTVGKEKALEQVMARADKDPRWKLLGAALHSIYKDWDQAVKLLDDVQQHFDELNPRLQGQALRISGPLYQLARPPQLDKARTAYEKLLKLEPGDLFALNNLATLLVDDSLVPNPQQAKVYSQQAFEQVKRAQPFPAAIWDTHGWVLVQCGGQDVDTGIGILQRVIRQTSLPEAHYHLGEAFLKKQDARKALSELQIAAKSINVAPENGIAVSPDLEKKIQSATERANEMLRRQSGEAVAR